MPGEPAEPGAPPDIPPVSSPDPDGTDGGELDPGGNEPSVLAIVSPEPGSLHVREHVGITGALVALVPVELEAAGPIERIKLELPDGSSLASATAVGSKLLHAELYQDGPVTILVHAYDAAGREVASNRLDVVIEAPQVESCHEWLDLYGVEYEPGPVRDGVDDPVTVTVPINGVSYRRWIDAGPRETFFMDCRLALSLARAAHQLRMRDVIEVVDMGVYNYRCIGNVGTPPDCPMSQHAYAMGLDIGGVTTGDGTYYSVEDDWIIDGSGESTCLADTVPGKDRFLHELICALKGESVWNIVLTPNYNSAHRNHFHVDLTEDANYIKSLEPDVGPDNH